MQDAYASGKPAALTHAFVSAASAGWSQPAAPVAPPASGGYGVGGNNFFAPQPPPAAAAAPPKPPGPAIAPVASSAGDYKPSTFTPQQPAAGQSSSLCFLAPVFRTIRFQHSTLLVSLEPSEVLMYCRAILC